MKLLAGEVARGPEDHENVCDLTRIEATLTAADSSSTPDSTVYWLDLLGRTMAENVDVEPLLGNPAVKFLYLNCGFLPCKCGD